MRFADKVEFVKEGERVYDRATGKYTSSESSSEVRLANVNEMANEFLSFAYPDGGMSNRGLTVRVKQAPTKSFDYIKVIGGKFKSDKKYKSVDGRQFKGKKSFQLEEVK